MFYDISSLRVGDDMVYTNFKVLLKILLGCYTKSPLRQLVVCILTPSDNVRGGRDCEENSVNTKRLITFHYLYNISPVSYTHLDVYKRQTQHIIDKIELLNC